MVSAQQGGVQEAKSTVEFYTVVLDASCLPSPSQIETTQEGFFVTFLQEDVSTVCKIDVTGRSAFFVSKDMPAKNVWLDIRGKEVPFTVTKAKAFPRRNAISVTGTIEIIHEDDFDNTENSRFIYFLQVPGGIKYELGTNRVFEQFSPGDLVLVAGDEYVNPNDKYFIDPVSSIKRVTQETVGEKELVTTPKSSLLTGAAITHVTHDSLGSQKTLVVFFDPHTQTDMNAVFGTNKISPLKIQSILSSPLGFFQWLFNVIFQALINSLIATQGNGGVVAFYAENSFDKVSFDIQFVGPLTLPANATCDLDAMARFALEEPRIRNHRVVLGEIDKLILVLPESPQQCPQPSRGTVGITEIYDANWTTLLARTAVSWDFLDTSYPLENQQYIISHELGHNLGMFHANSFGGVWGSACDPFLINCSIEEYGNTLSVMGNGLHHHTAFDKSQFNWITANNSRRVLLQDGESIDLELHPLSSRVQSGELQEILLPISVVPPQYEQRYWQANFSAEPVMYSVELRVPDGFDATNKMPIIDTNGFNSYQPLQPSVFVTMGSREIHSSTLVVGTPLYWNHIPGSEAGFRTGAMFSDPYNGYSFTVLNISSTGASNESTAWLRIEKSVPSATISVGPCEIPYDEMRILRSTTLCPGVHTISHIEIIRDDVILDCAHATLRSSSGWWPGISTLGSLKNVTIKNCNLEDYRTGILLAGSDVSISNTVISNSSEGINIQYSQNVSLENTTVFSIQDGIRLINVSSAIVANTLVSSADGDGVSLEEVERSVMVNNTVTGTRPVGSTAFCDTSRGIMWWSGSENTIENNHITRVCKGIYGFAWYGGTINNNIITHNIINDTYEGIFLEAGVGAIVSNNTISDNKFYEVINPLFSRQNNTFSHNFFGACTDTNNDGICDSPFLFAINQEDPAPSSR